MQFITHPTQIRINGFTFEVLALTTLTDEQASRIALHFYRSHRLRKKDKGKLLQVVTQVDANSAGMFGA